VGNALWLTAAAVLAVAIYGFGQAADASTATPPPTMLIATLDYSFWAAGFFGMLALIGCAIPAAMATVAGARTAPARSAQRAASAAAIAVASYGLVALLAAPW
jgi:hypothetical protein